MSDPGLSRRTVFSRRRVLWLASGAGALALTGCTSAPVEDADAAGDPALAGGGYPRTIATEDGPVTLSEPVQAVAALSPDVADVMLALVGPERMVAVPETTTKPQHSLHADLAGQVPHVVATQGVGDPEQILGYGPDLVMLTTRHDREADARAQLAQAGVPLLSITNDWDSPEVFAANVTLIGEVLGAEAEAAALVEDHRSRWQAVLAEVPDQPAEQRPVVGMIRTLGQNLWLTGPGTIGHTAIIAAGARPLVEELGLDSGVRMEVEHLVNADPDGLVLVDTTGRGRDQYAEMLASPGIAELSAVRADHIAVVTSGELASGTGGIEAFETIAAAVKGWK
ncbi:ABC transporter substrate-binding protein [Parenemella sanctibonifatiensis]|uniref:Fe/B12 periplasmic-binding domain-containing protein n=1 Tax=Parenemella sanctibonifatiensis TaxID=2016505 RepID=A0A255E197_9ACTN|nr:ABC transporter substrate-binding protein [Parenemella sanctibonifatiensis]OYN85314.1 hypothetical protein CGZ92_10960 [Parenemella sanctibonifatiensis]